MKIKKNLHLRLQRRRGKTLPEHHVLESKKIIQCVQKKRTTYFQTAVTPFRIVEIKKVRRDSERARVDLSNAYNYFPVTQ